MNECVTRREERLAAVSLALTLLSLACESREEARSPDDPPQNAVGAEQAEQAERNRAADAVPPWGNRVSEGGGFPCDVDRVLALSCRRCHYEPPENDAPFPLVKYEHVEVIRSGKPIHRLMEQMVAADLMPPLDEPVEPKVTPLTPEQKSTLLGWLKAGAPKNADPCP